MELVLRLHSAANEPRDFAHVTISHLSEGGYRSFRATSRCSMRIKSQRLWKSLAVPLPPGPPTLPIRTYLLVEGEGITQVTTNVASGCDESHEGRPTGYQGLQGWHLSSCGATVLPLGLF